VRIVDGAEGFHHHLAPAMEKKPSMTTPHHIIDDLMIEG
jgi:hypothetical protein